jgi:hypothetical protein
MSVKSNVYPVATAQRKLTQYSNLSKTNRWKPQLKRLYRKCPTMVYHHIVYQLAVIEASSFDAPDASIKTQEDNSEAEEEEH